MPVRPHACLALGLLATAVMVWAEEPASDSAKSAEALESASRDLEALSTRQPNLSPRASLADDPAVLPFVIPPANTRSSGGTGDQPATGPSRGWLLDALLENQQRSRFRASARDDRSIDVPELAGERYRNPLNGYLQSWMSPRDRKILMPGLDDSPEHTPLGGSGTQETWRPRSSIDASPLVADARTGTSLRQPGNPYLDPAQATALGFNVEALSPPARRIQPVETLTTPVLPIAGQDDALPQLAPPPQSQAAPTPSAPLVDDQRYFPQLRRF